MELIKKYKAEKRRKAILKQTVISMILGVVLLGMMYLTFIFTLSGIAIRRGL